MESKSGAAWISARTAVEEVIAPVVGLAVLNVVATWLLRESSYVLRRPEAVGFSNNLPYTNYINHQSNFNIIQNIFKFLVLSLNDSSSFNFCKI